MRITPQLVASFRVPPNARRVPDVPGTTDTPTVQRWPRRRLVVVRRDDELIAYDLEMLVAGDEAPAARFPAPWPRAASGIDAVSPDLALAVFSGPHALHAVDADGTLRWRVRHSCWEGSCTARHDSYAEYADDPGHRYPDSGSCWISADGSTVWAHVRTPLPDDTDPTLDEEWLVLDATDGRVLGRASTETNAAGSHHVPHPDPGQLGLSVGEGQDGVPLCWGRWDGTRLTVTRLGDDDRCLVDVDPGGTRFVTVSHAGDEVAIHRLPDGAVTHLVSADRLPPEAESPVDADEKPVWHYQCGFVDEGTVVVSTETYQEPQHWLIDATRGEVLGRVAYPRPVSEAPTGLGDGTWLTSGEDPFELLLWRTGGPGPG